MRESHETLPQSVALGTVVYFDSRSTDLTDAAREQLRALAARARDSDALHFAVRGHADELGSDERNEVLSGIRAEGVAVFLTELGIARARMHTEACGEREPAELGHDPGAWARNRRVEVTTFAGGAPR
jgi:outer membrane protein OmpA-like peptidoglycan-associated protein